MSAPDVVPEKTTDWTTERCVVQKFDDIDDISRNFRDMSGKGAAKESVFFSLISPFLRGFEERYVLGIQCHPSDRNFWMELFIWTNGTWVDISEV